MSPLGTLGSTRGLSSTVTVRPTAPSIVVACVTDRPARFGTVTSRIRIATRMAAAANTR